jgi:hypothetical protein
MRIFFQSQLQKTLKEKTAAPTLLEMGAAGGLKH